MKNNALSARINLVFGIIMGLVYITAGLFVYFSDGLHFSQDYHKKVLGAVIVVYGFFRFYKVYKKSFDKNQIQEENDEE